MRQASKIWTFTGLGGHDALKAELHSLFGVVDNERIHQFVGRLV
jgi:hypothetical protein